MEGTLRPEKAADLAETQLIRERDHAQAAADGLDDAISALLGVEIGEHSNANSPWDNAHAAALAAIRAVATVPVPVEGCALCGAPAGATHRYRPCPQAPHQAPPPGTIDPIPAEVVTAAAQAIEECAMRVVGTMDLDVADRDDISEIVLAGLRAAAPALRAAGRREAAADVCAYAGRIRSGAWTPEAGVVMAAIADQAAVLAAGEHAPAGLPAHLRGDGPCRDCGTRDNIRWVVRDAHWNLALGGPEARDDPGGILCIPCFVARADAAGIDPTYWVLVPRE